MFETTFLAAAKGNCCVGGDTCASGGMIAHGCMGHGASRHPWTTVQLLLSACSAGTEVVLVELCQSRYVSRGMSVEVCQSRYVSLGMLIECHWKY